MHPGARHLTVTTAGAMALASFLAAYGAVGSPASAAGEPAAGVPVAQTANVAGTISAQLDGQARTWHVVSHELSGSWTELKPGQRLVTVVGFDSETPPIASFTRDAAGRLASYGTYDGSLFMVTIETGATPRPLTLTLPSADSGTNLVMYVTRAGSLDPARSDPAALLSAMHLMQTGTLAVSSIGLTGDRFSLEGTFRGTLEAAAGRPVTVTDGRFQARNLPRTAPAR